MIRSPVDGSPREPHSAKQGSSLYQALSPTRSPDRGTCEAYTGARVGAKEVTEMIRRFLAGLLLVMGGASIAVGVSPAWVTPSGSGQALNGFTLGSGPVDAVVSFVLGGVLMLVGLVIALRGGALSRALGMLTSLLA